MARIQILPLPTQKAGDFEHTPFILILDQADRGTEDWPAEYVESLREQTGAVTVLAHEATLDAPGALDLTEEQRAELLAYLTQPRRWEYRSEEDAITARRIQLGLNDRLAGSL